MTEHDLTTPAAVSDGDRLVAYRDLPLVDGVRHAWGIWGEQDVFGTLNRLTPERVRAAVAEIRRGEVFPCNWDLALPEPGLFERPSLRHDLVHADASAPVNDVISDWNTQSSSQWDGFRHITWAGHGNYNGHRHHGMHHWASRGIVGRCVLADVARWRASVGRPLVFDRPDLISPEDLLATLEAQRVEVRTGDILLIRTGWIPWYMGSDASTRRRISDRMSLTTPGLTAAEPMVELLWDMHLAGIAGDNPALEAWPTRCDGTPCDTAEDPSGWRRVFDYSLHTRMIGGLGLAFGEMWDLERLAADCAEDGVYCAFLSSAPLNLAGAAASPANVVVIK